MSKTIYDLEITEIVNCIHECSRVVEAIECKTEFTRRPMEEEATDPNKQPDAGAGSSTPLIGELARAKQTAGNLLQRLIDLDNSICSTVTELDSGPDSGERSAAGQGK